ncbi:ABC transporter ATP-binding protein [Chloroflexota bacterium]
MALLEIRQLTKNFGGLVAVNDVDFDVNEGAIVGLIGPNGAGKTTIFNLVCGVYKPTRGKVIFKGKDVTNLSPDRVAVSGMVRTFQQTALFQDFSVLQNVLLGFHLSSKKSFFGNIFNSRVIREQESILQEKALELLKLMGLDTMSAELAKNLPYGYQRTLGVAMALAAGPKLLLLDEPVAGMNASEVSTMMNIIGRIRERGCTILLVEHIMRVVMQLCDRVVVLNFGNKIAEGLPEEIRNNDKVLEAYLGVENAAID